ncbi:MAG TPA: PilT/PilU family type 4a pilus ATPase [Vicinamibacterales bacterium]
MSETRNHPVNDLDKLVSELHLISQASSAPIASDSPNLADWLRQVREQDGSDLLLVASLPPLARIKGQMSRLIGDILSGEDIENAVSPVIPSRLRERYRDGEAIDVGFTLKGLGRFRMNLHRERGRPAAAIRALPTRIPRVADLHFTHDIALLAELPRGLVLVCGPTGSGKTTTLAALIAEINSKHARHIVTVEDPIEYEHSHGRSVIEQVEIGNDARDFPTALRSAMRQAPDVIVVGEMRDPETMRIALAAAETGHLVLATVHATDAAAAVSRIADGFPVERQNAVRQELAMALAAVLTQSLVQTKAGTLVPVAELLLVSYGARQHIRKNALQHLNQEITITRKAGSFTSEESLAKLVLAGTLDRGDAMVRAAHPEELESLLRGA